VSSEEDPGWRLGFSLLRFRGNRSRCKKQIPFGDDNQKGKGDYKSNDNDNGNSLMAG
jgi:hypothetical protein